MGITGTTPATRWESYGTFPKVFTLKTPKAIMVNEEGIVTMLDQEGNSVAFFLAAGIPIQLRPSQITSTAIQGGAGPVIALFD
jgi:hypothetical protein